MDAEREKSIREQGEFKGIVVATLTSIQREQEDMRLSLEKHLEEEMVELKIFNERLLHLENWKIKVVTLSSVIGTILGFVLNLVIQK